MYSHRLISRVLAALLVFGLLYSVLNWRVFFQLLYPVYYEDIIGRYSREYGIDPFLVTSIILVESGFQEHAQSTKGASGLMQLMPDTARWVASQLGYPQFDEKKLFDPNLNVQLGTWYLASLYRQFGDWVIALAAYNGGHGNVQKWLDEARWSGEAETVEDIPFGETRFYVSRVVRTYGWYHRIYRGDWEYAVAVGSPSSNQLYKAAGSVVYWFKRIVYSLVKQAGPQKTL